MPLASHYLRLWVSFGIRSGWILSVSSIDTGIICLRLRMLVPYKTLVLCQRPSLIMFIYIKKHIVVLPQWARIALYSPVTLAEQWDESGTCNGFQMNGTRRPGSSLRIFGTPWHPVGYFLAVLWTCEIWWKVSYVVNFYNHVVIKILGCTTLNPMLLSNIVISPSWLSKSSITMSLPSIFTNCFGNNYITLFQFKSATVSSWYWWSYQYL